MNEVTIIGGAAGVGKTTLLKSLKGYTFLSTGTFFKKQMTINTRDNIRKNDWSFFEAAVGDDLAKNTIHSLGIRTNVIIDTHFAAKIHNKNYRIGLKRPLIFKFAKSIIEKTPINKTLKFNVILITTEPHALLERRRKDKTRDRELVPSDCVSGLKYNELYVKDYYFELLRAREKTKSPYRVDLHFKKIHNNDFSQAQQELKRTLK